MQISINVTSIASVHLVCMSTSLYFARYGAEEGNVKSVLKHVIHSCLQNIITFLIPLLSAIRGIVISSTSFSIPCLFFFWGLTCTILGCNILKDLRIYSYV